MPVLENVMFNYMNCQMMMFGPKVKYSVTYKTNQKSFNVFRRKTSHDFRVTVVKNNFEGSKGIDMASAS